ncbi:MAG: nitroreductase family protein [Syntrophaceae bacterium]|nr:nitroreductase family protein [Syntrophaceae bacterium]
MEAILSRRSIRQYTSQKVSDHLVRELLEAAMSAPSANNEQPWHFVILDDRKIMSEIPKFHPYSSMLREAPLAILVCVDLSLGSEGFLVQDGSAATENILIAAHARGLGAVWLGVYPLKERINGMRRLLGIPDRILPLALISMGYPAEKISRANRYQASRVHTNRW